MNTFTQNIAVAAAKGGAAAGGVGRIGCSCMDFG